ncbi:MAG: hypothetical protein HYX94_07930 [Chloroflexi bacterium]|nr:hypothetical protein [Chloroflexota bacterium]
MCSGWPAGVAVFMLLVGPYAAALIPRLDTVRRLAIGGGEGTRVDADSLRFTFQVVGNDGYQAFANQAGRLCDADAGLPLVLSLLLAGLLAVGLAVSFARLVRAFRRRDAIAAAPYLIMLAPVVLPALLFVRHSSPVYPYYLLVGYPMHFVFSALGVRYLMQFGSKLAERGPRALKLLPTATVGGLLVVVAAMQLSVAQIFFAVVGEYWSKNDYGLPLAYARQAVDAAEELAAAQGIDSIYVLGSYTNDTVRPDSGDLVQTSEVTPTLRLKWKCWETVRPDPGTSTIFAWWTTPTPPTPAWTFPSTSPASGCRVIT